MGIQIHQMFTFNYNTELQTNGSFPAVMLVCMY